MRKIHASSCAQAAGSGMIVLQEDKSDWPLSHFAFTVSEADIEDAAARLQEQGIATTGPHFYEWMPAQSVSFSDLDYHDLELGAPLGQTESE